MCIAIVLHRAIDGLKNCGKVPYSILLFVIAVVECVCTAGLAAYIVTHKHNLQLQQDDIMINLILLKAIVAAIIYGAGALLLIKRMLCKRMILRY